jgi:hypothetical protein
MKITVLNISHHRNGITGAPFYAVVFRDSGPDASVKLGIVFEAPAHVAVLDIAKLADCDVKFGSNSYRGDNFEPPLRQAVAGHRRKRHEELGQDDESSLDIHGLLARRRQVAVIWCIEDVQGIRPDLSDEKAWQVLQQCEKAHDCEAGFNWLLIETVADDLFPEEPSTKE